MDEHLLFSASTVDGYRVASLDTPGARIWMILAAVSALLFAPSGPLAPSSTTDHDHTRSQPRSSSAFVAGSRVGIDEAYQPFIERRADLNADFDAIQASGAKWVSFDFDWSTVQDAGPGSFDWSVLDRGVAAANARGLRVLAIPDYTPSWGRGPGTDNKYPPTNVADYVTFVTAAVTRYSHRGVHTWAIWNEPNNPSFWKPNPDVAAYTTMLKAAYTAIKSLDPHARVLDGGTAPASAPLSPADWLRALYANGARGFFDAANHHPYAGLPYAPATIAPWNPFQQTLDLHQVMINNRDGQKQIWGTEVGAYTGTAAGAVSPATQARYITQYLQLWNSWTFTGPLFIYELRDGGTNRSNREENWGLHTPTLTPKPAWTAFTNAIRR